MIAIRKVTVEVHVCAVCEILMNNLNNNSLYCEPCRSWVHRSRMKSSGLLRKGLKEGKINPTLEDTKCVDCGKTATDYDHRDYNRPLKVVPVCRSCNYKRGGATPRKDCMYIENGHVETSIRLMRSLR